MNWFEASDSLEQETCAEALWGNCLATFTKAGFSAVVYLTSDDERSKVTLRTNVPTVYESVSPEREPFLQYCCHSYKVTLMGPDYLPAHDYLNDQEKAFVARATRLGVFSAFGIPVRLSTSNIYGGFILGSPLRADAFEATYLHETDALQAHCIVLHRRFGELSKAALPSVLSPREKDVIRQLIEGAERKEIARYLELSPHTVAEYTKSAYRKLGVRNRVEAAQKLAGWIRAG